MIHLHSTFLEIYFTNVTKLTNVHPSVLYIKVHQFVFGKLYTIMCKNVYSNVCCKRVLECILFIKFLLVYFLQSTSGCKMCKNTLGWTLVSLASLVKWISKNIYLQGILCAPVGSAVCLLHKGCVYLIWTCAFQFYRVSHPTNSEDHLALLFLSILMRALPSNISAIDHRLIVIDDYRTNLTILFLCSIWFWPKY